MFFLLGLFSFEDPCPECLCKICTVTAEPYITTAWPRCVYFAGKICVTCRHLNGASSHFAPKFKTSLQFILIERKNDKSRLYVRVTLPISKLDPSRFLLVDLKCPVYWIFSPILVELNSTNCLWHWCRHFTLICNRHIDTPQLPNTSWLGVRNNIF